MRRRIVLHPFLFALFPVLFLYSHNIQDGSVGPRHLVWPAVAALGATAVLLLLARVLLKDSARAGLAVSGIVALFFFYGHLSTLVGDLAVGGVNLGRDRFLLGLLGVAGLLFLVLVARSKSQLVEATKILNIFGVILAATTLVGIGRGVASAVGGTGAGDVERPSAVELEPKGRTPDIYYLIFDRYAGNRTMLSALGYDNRPFLDDLIARGFYVAEDATSNYPATAPSFASSFNMSYLEFLTTAAGKDSADAGPVVDAFQNGAVQESLVGAGYRIVHISSWWEPTYDNPNADLTLKYPSASYFARSLLETTAYKPIATRFGLAVDRLDLRRVAFRTAKFQFDAIKQAHTTEGPKFVFAHILLPHVPYVFDSEGNYVTLDLEKNRSHARNYVEQLEYTNKRILEILTVLISGEPTSDPIVILQADEGLSPERFDRTFGKFSWLETSDKELRDKFPILNAYYLPGVAEPGLYPTITPVNSFRKVFNLYFGTNLDILPDHNFTFPDFDHIYDFRDVTEKVR